MVPVHRWFVAGNFFHGDTPFNGAGQHAHVAPDTRIAIDRKDVNRRATSIQLQIRCRFALEFAWFVTKAFAVLVAGQLFPMNRLVATIFATGKANPAMDAGRFVDISDDFIIQIEFTPRFDSGVARPIASSSVEKPLVSIHFVSR